MKAKTLIIALIIITLVGSFLTLFAANMLFADIINIDSLFNRSSTFFVTLPAMNLAIFLVMLVLYLIRTYKRPDCVKRITFTYSIITIVLGAFGVIGVILSAVSVYGDFLSPYPFRGYIPIFLALNLLLLGTGIFGLIRSKKMKDDEGRIKINFGHVMKTIGWFLFICLMFNRFGTLLAAPVFIYLRNLYLTWPFYLYLALPVFLGVIKVLQILKLASNKKLFLLSSIALGLNVIFFAYIVIVALNDTGFISSLSQAMPLERMSSKPLEIAIHFLAYAGLGTCLLLQARPRKEK